MKYLDEEDKEKLNELGKKILQAKKLRSEITDFFVTKADDDKLSQANYYGAQELLDVISLFIRGESADFIGEQVFQEDGTLIINILKLMNIDKEKTEI